MLEKIDFSKSARLEPREGSWEKVVQRIAEKRERQKNARFLKFSSLSIAASVLLVAGALVLGFGAKASVLSENIQEDLTFDTFSWFAALGSGEAVSTFSTPLDNYYATRE